MSDLPTVVSGICCIVSAVSLAVRHAVLSPKNASWPHAPGPLRGIMFILLALLVWRGIGLLSIPPGEGGHIAPVGALTYVALAVYFVAMTANLVRQNYPVRVWKAVNKIQFLASCRPGSRLPEVVAAGIASELRAEGFEVEDEWTLDNFQAHETHDLLTRLDARE